MKSLSREEPALSVAGLPKRLRRVVTMSVSLRDLNQCLASRVVLRQLKETHSTHRRLVTLCGKVTALVHLVGTPNPNPSKAAEFRSIDLASIGASVAAGVQAGTAHLIYVSVAQPAPLMKSMSRPARKRKGWMPLYGMARHFSSMREPALRLGIATIKQMVTAIVLSAENPPQTGAVIVMVVPAIREARIH